MRARRMSTRAKARPVTGVARQGVGAGRVAPQLVRRRRFACCLGRTRYGAEGEAMAPVGRHMANQRRKCGLGKDPEQAAKIAQQLTTIDPDWSCPWPPNWQRHYRVLADLSADEPTPRSARGCPRPARDPRSSLPHQPQEGAGPSPRAGTTADATKFADEWLHPHPGTDGALAMAMGHVILRECFVDRQVP